MIWPIIACTLLLSAAINRLRGTDISGSRVYASVAFGLLAGLVLWDWRAGIAAALGFLFWASMSWGRWFDLERLPDDWNREPGKISTFDKTIESISFGSDHLAFFLRHLVGILPLGATLILYCGWEWLGISIAFALLAVLAYELAHWAYDAKKGEDFVPFAEIVTGVVWGALLLSVYFLCHQHFKGIEWGINEMAKA